MFKRACEQSISGSLFPAKSI